MTDFRVFIYADGLVLPLVAPFSCNSRNLGDRLQAIFAHDLVATRAEVWDGPVMIMQIDSGGIAALVRLAVHEAEPAEVSRSLH